MNSVVWWLCGTFCVSMAQQITISVPDGADERLIGAIYQAVANVLLGNESGLPDEAEVHEAQSREANWPYAAEAMNVNLYRFLTNVTENARLLIRGIAVETLAREEPVTATRLRARLEAPKDGTMGGWAASIGFASKRLKLPKPYSRSYKHTGAEWESVYSMEPSVAEAVVDLVDPMGNVERPASPVP